MAMDASIGIAHGSSDRTMVDTPSEWKQGQEEKGNFTSAETSLTGPKKNVNQSDRDTMMSDPAPGSTTRLCRRKRTHDDLTFYGAPKHDDQTEGSRKGGCMATLYRSGKHWYELQGNEDPTWIEESKEQWIPVPRRGRLFLIAPT